MPDGAAAKPGGAYVSLSVGEFDERFLQLWICNWVRSNVALVA